MRLAILPLLGALLALFALALLAPPTRPVSASAGMEYGAIPSGYGPGAQPLQQTNDEPDKTEMILITLGIVGAAALISLIGYVIRQRVGFWPHRPPPPDAANPEEHH